MMEDYTEKDIEMMEKAAGMLLAASDHDDEEEIKTILSLTPNRFRKTLVEYADWLLKNRSIH